MYLQCVLLMQNFGKLVCYFILNISISTELQTIKGLLHGSSFAFSVWLPETWSTVQLPSKRYQTAE